PSTSNFRASVRSSWGRASRSDIPTSCPCRTTVRCSRFGLLAAAFAKLDAADLAGERLGQLVGELDNPRGGVCGEAVAHECLDICGERLARLVPGGRHHEGLDDVPAPLVWRCDGGSLANGRVLQAHRLDFERTDAIAGGDDHVVGATLVPHV